MKHISIQKFINRFGECLNKKFVNCINTNKRSYPEARPGRCYNMEGNKLATKSRFLDKVFITTHFSLIWTNATSLCLQILLIRHVNWSKRVEECWIFYLLYRQVHCISSTKNLHSIPTSKFKSSCLSAKTILFH